MSEQYADSDTKEPGLHQVGPEPYAFVFNPAKGLKVSFVDENGEVHTGAITDFSEDDETGSIDMTVERWPSDSPYFWID